MAKKPVMIGIDIGELTTDGIDMPAIIAALERDYILQAMELASGNKLIAASLLGLKRTTLVEKMKRFGIGQKTNEAEQKIVEANLEDTEANQKATEAEKKAAVVELQAFTLMRENEELRKRLEELEPLKIV